jgi:hypothetical protein
MNTFTDRFWNRVREYELALRLFFVADVLFVMLSLSAYPFVEPGSAAHVLVVLDLLIFVGLLVPLTYFLYQCRKLRLEEEKL